MLQITEMGGGAGVSLALHSVHSSLPCYMPPEVAVAAVSQSRQETVGPVGPCLGLFSGSF